MDTQSTGTPIPGYTMIRKIGSGGSAEVYLAVQQNLNRRVALKLVQGTLASDSRFGERFKREGRIIAQLNHPHIIPVYDIGEYNGQYYMAMEYLSGGDLRSQAEQLTLNDLLEVILQVTRGLKAAHDRGFVHRDIKPANILFRSQKQAVLTDFGIARQAESLTHMTVTGAMLGTPAYMSPEQISGRTLDGRADLYSLGITLFEMLTGYLPYRGESMMSVAMQQISADIPRLPEASSSLQVLADRLLAKNPDDRITDAEALEGELQKFTGLQEKSAIPLTSLWPEQAPETDSTSFAYRLTDAKDRNKFERKKGLTYSIAAVTLIATIGIGTWYSIDSTRIFDSDNTQTNLIEDTPTRQVDSTTPSKSETKLNSENPTDGQVTDPLQEILTQANQHYEQGRLIAPAGDNALDLYRQVLEQDSSNIIAKSGESNILRRLVLEVEQSIAEQTLDQAGQQLATLSGLWPDEAELEQLQEQIVQSRQHIEARKLAEADAQKRQKINQHLQDATSAMIAGRYLEPRKESALHHFKRVLTLEPDNRAAEQGISQIAEAMSVKIQSAISNNDFTLAESLLKDLHSVNPQHERLQPLSDAIESARAAFERHQMEQQRLTNLQLQIDKLIERDSQWRISTAGIETQSNTGNQLVADISRLLNVHPENNQLRSLYSTANQRLRELTLQQKQQPSRKPILGGF